MEASTASCSTPRLGRVTKDAAVGSPRWILTVAKMILKDDRVLSSLLKSLSQEDDFELQKHAARTLRNLAAAEDHRTKLKILNEDGTLKGLVNCLVKGIEDTAMGDLMKCLTVTDKPGLQKSALQVLHLSLLNYTDSYVKMLEKIVTEKSVIGSLVKFLSVFDDHAVQEGALDILYFLADHYDSEVIERIADEDGAITVLVKCMVATNKPSLQQKAVLALEKLACHEDDSVREKIAVRIADENGAIAGFVKCLSANCDSQKESAAVTLARLVQVEDDTVKQRIIEEDGAISGLLKCVASPSIVAKREATRALATITKGSGDCRKRPKLY